MVRRDREDRDGNEVRRDRRVGRAGDDRFRQPHPDDCGGPFERGRGRRRDRIDTIGYVEPCELNGGSRRWAPTPT
jgi:hypothetical protein